MEEKLKQGILSTVRAAVVVMSLTIASMAADITGTVTNKTTNKPAAGDDVVLLKLSGGMDEAARTKTDANGRFTLPLADPAGAHLVRVNHRNVNYFRSAPPGTTSVEVDVYDAAEKLEGVRQSLDIMRMEGDATNLRVIEMYALNNDSKPPRTLMSAKSFEIALPDGAKIDQALAAGPGGMPVTSTPVPTGEKNHYAFIFPIRPGETRFQIQYSLPYNGNTEITPKLLRPTDSFAVSVPTSMKVELAAGSKLNARGQDAGMNVYVAQDAAPGQSLSFKVSGTGTIPIPAEEASQQAGAATSGPGGGLGTPINTPDPLYQYRWWIIGGVGLILVAGAAFSMSAQPRTAGVASAVASKTPLLDALKEESFRLESDRLQDKISAEEYAHAKAALDVVLRRAMAQKPD